jgi:mono/diheme cytochrome c family protein
MGRFSRWVLRSLFAVSALLVAALGTFFVLFPRVEPAPVLRVARTPQQIARGTYLAEHVAICTDCHSQRDFSRYSGPVREETRGKGGERFGREMGFPGTLIAPNITPYALSDWSDGEIARAITAGFTPEGRSLFPLMNYPAFATMCERDLHSVVSYLRELEPIASDPPRSELDFPVNLLVRTMPAPAHNPVNCPDPQDSVAQGRYLVTLASCTHCHTQHEGADPVAGMEFAGGVEFRFPDGTLARSANITPDLDTGIGGWSREVFVNRFKQYSDPSQLHKVGAGERNTVMPWSQYAGMTERDLGAIYDYLRTLPPVRTESRAAVARR